MTKDEALRLALEALEVANSLVDGYYLPKEKAWLPEIEEAITAIKAALEAKDEPVAWMHVQGNHEEPSLRQLDDWEIQNGWKQYPLYTTPPQRTWVGLTDEDRFEFAKAQLSWEDLLVVAEAKLKEKNT